MAMPRNFNASPGIRRAVPVLMGIYGPSGSGKTFSALRVAAGEERVTRKPTFVIDTENGRALHYADRFAFQHVPFDPPFGAEAYLEALNFCERQGAGQIIVDSGSHEHEGEGGLLDVHARHVEKHGEKQSMLGWMIAKRPHDKLRNALARTACHQIWCFRSKEKLKMAARGDSDREPKKLGWMPVGGTDLVYEMTLTGLLMPGARGVAQWRSHEAGEGVVIKVPAQFEELTDKLRGPLSEEVGEALARWGAGDAAPAAKPPSDPMMKFHPNYDASLAGSPLEDADPVRLLDYIEWLRPNTNPKAKAHLALVEELYEQLLAAEGAP
jgi:hypothetical protein